MEIKELNKQYKDCCNLWVQMFCEKQEIDFDGWISDEVGGTCSFCGEYFFNMSDIILDLNTNQPKGLILAWQNANTNIDYLMNPPQHINYKSYTMGLRHNQLNNYQNGKEVRFDGGGKVRGFKYYSDDDANDNRITKTDRTVEVGFTY